MSEPARVLVATELQGSTKIPAFRKLLAHFEPVLGPFDMHTVDIDAVAALDRAMPFFLVVPSLWRQTGGGDGPANDVDLRLPGRAAAVHLPARAVFFLPASEPMNTPGDAAEPARMLFAYWRSMAWDMASATRSLGVDQVVGLMEWFSGLPAAGFPEVWAARARTLTDPCIRSVRMLATTERGTEPLWSWASKAGWVEVSSLVNELLTVLDHQGRGDLGDQQQLNAERSSVFDGRELTMLVVSPETGAPVTWHVLLERVSLRTGILEPMKQAVSSLSERLKSTLAHSLASLGLEHSYSRHEFELQLPEVAPWLTLGVVLAGNEAEVTVRRLSLQYARYVRETFGTRLSPDEAQAITELAQMEDGTTVTATPHSASNASGADLEVRIQAGFLWAAARLACLLSEPGDPLPRVPHLCEHLGRSLGHLLPKTCRPYQRLFVEMLLLDCAGTGPVLEQFLLLGARGAGAKAGDAEPDATRTRFRANADSISEERGQRSERTRTFRCLRRNAVRNRRCCVHDRRAGVRDRRNRAGEVV